MTLQFKAHRLASRQLSRECVEKKKYISKNYNILDVLDIVHALHVIATSYFQFEANTLFDGLAFTNWT